MQFWRPLSAATHVVDHAVAPGNSVFAHAQSVAWMAALAAVAMALFRRIHGPGPVAGLAGLLYAVDEAHGFPAGWLANRNALICGVLGLLALLAHDRWRRDGWRPGAGLGPALLGAALLAGESGVAVTGWLFAYAVFLDRRRLWTLLPHAAVAVAWKVVHAAGGYGATGSGLYIDPLSDPGGYALALPRRLVALGADQFLSFPSMLLPFVPGPLAHGLVVALAAALAALGVALAPAWRGNAKAGFWATGLVLSLLPVAATFPSPRLLTFAGLGGAGLLALAFDGARRGLGRPGLLALLFVLHGPVAAVGLAIQSVGVVSLDRLLFAPCDEATPSDPSIEGRTVVFVNSNDLCTGYVRHTRAARGEPGPATVLLLGSALYDVEVHGVDGHTIDFVVPAGMQSQVADRLFRTGDRPLPVGHTVELPTARIEVLSHNAAGLTDRIRFRFAVPLADPSLHWVCTRAQRPAPFVPPKPGAVVSLPGAFTSL